MSITLTSEAFVNALIDVTNEAGYGHVYISQDGYKAGESGVTCVNWFTDDTPACIVGRALVHMGLSVGAMRSAGVGRCEGAWQAIPRLLDSGLGVNENEADRRILQSIADLVQELQDGGMNWGEAVEKAVIAQSGHATLLHRLNIPEEKK